MDTKGKKALAGVAVIAALGLGYAYFRSKDKTASTGSSSGTSYSVPTAGTVSYSGDNGIGGGSVNDSIGVVVMTNEDGNNGSVPANYNGTPIPDLAEDPGFSPTTVGNVVQSGPGSAYITGLFGPTVPYTPTAAPSYDSVL